MSDSDAFVDYAKDESTTKREDITVVKGKLLTTSEKEALSQTPSATVNIEDSVEETITEKPIQWGLSKPKREMIIIKIKK